MRRKAHWILFGVLSLVFIAVSWKLVLGDSAGKPSQTSSKGGLTSDVEVFFGNSKLDPEVSCTKMFPVTRAVPETKAPGAAAIDQLLLGPTPFERSKEYFTNINPGVTLQSLKVASGTAYADFSEALEQDVGGSCRVAAIRQQITQTLEQFPTVQNVVISINGRTEDILQP